MFIYFSTLSDNSKLEQLKLKLILSLTNGLLGDFSENAALQMHGE